MQNHKVLDRMLSGWVQSLKQGGRVSGPCLILFPGLKQYKTIKYKNALRLGATRQKGQRSWRQAVTGSPDTRIRDYIKGVPQVNTICLVSE